MKWKEVLIVTVFVLILIGYGCNFAGRSVYLYLNFGSRDLVVASSNGVSHMAISEHVEFVGPADTEDLLEYGGVDLTSTEILNTGPILLFTETEEKGLMAKYFVHFDYSPSDPGFVYTALEFPLWMWVIPFLLLYLAFAKQGSLREQNKVQDDS